MTQHVASNQYSRAEISNYGLSCPFAKSAPEAYMSIDTCKPNEGFKEVRLLLYAHPRPPISREQKPPSSAPIHQ